MQVAAARETTLGPAGRRARALQRDAARVDAPARRSRIGALAVVGSLLREPIAHLLGVPEHPWAAAAILPTGVLWLLLSLQRGVLQGLRAYGRVGLSHRRRGRAGASSAACPRRPSGWA